MLNRPTLWTRIGKFWSRDTEWSSWSSPHKLEKYCARRMKRAGWEIRWETAYEDVRFHAYYNNKKVSVACKLDGRLSIIHCGPIQRFARKRGELPVIIVAGKIDRLLHNSFIDGDIYLITLDDIERLVEILNEPIDNLRPQPYVHPDIPDSWEILRRSADSGTAA